MTTTDRPYRQKLIEVALPLDDINREAAREKSIRHGHPSTLHLWWARRPLAAARAVLFASLVDDPTSDPAFEGATDTEIEEERERLFQIIRDLVKWENSTNEEVLGRARAEIMRSTDGNPPPVLDPFCGGGSIPLEAQRLGLEAHGSDLNPVAVLITKAMIEIPPKFAGCPPVNPVDRAKLASGEDWPRATGLAADVRHYGKWMRDEAERRIGHLYPKATLPDGGEATVIAWLWARTVTCPNPACGARMPLVSSFELSKKPGKQAWVEPVIDLPTKTVRFEVKTGKGPVPAPPKQGRGAKFACLVCGSIPPDAHIKTEGNAKRMGAHLMAVVAEGKGGRTYLAPTKEHEQIAASASPEWTPAQQLAHDPRNIWCIPYGLTTFGDLFTHRQLVALTTFSDLVADARARAHSDARAAGLPDGDPLHAGGWGATAYADAVATYLALVMDRTVDRTSTLCTWDSSPKMEALRNTYARQALPMTWDYAEGNPFSKSSGNWLNNVDWTSKALEQAPAGVPGFARQANAITLPNGHNHIVSTDPPYYDNIGYADLSDFFYVWLRRSLEPVFPDLLNQLLVPKKDELIASPYRHGGSKHDAEHFFEKNFRTAFWHLKGTQRLDYPLIVYYAYKQSEAEAEQAVLTLNGSSPNGHASTGWETMLSGMIDTGFEITGTWPMRTELGNRMIGRGTNALASSIVLVCRMRPADAPTRTRRDFLADLNRELPDKLLALLHGNIAPVDLEQSAIGPGMSIYSRYSKVLELDGTGMSVRVALVEINRALQRFLDGLSDSVDTDTRFCIKFFQQHRHQPAPYGDAEGIALARNISVRGVAEAGVIRMDQGKVRLIRSEEYDPAWDPTTDPRVPIWQAMQQLILAFDTGGAESAAALAERLGAERATAAKDLAYYMFSLCARNGWSEDAIPYDGLVRGWADISLREATAATPAETQTAIW